MSIEFSIALRFFHYFIRDNWGIYDASLFQRESGLAAGLSLLSDIDLKDILDDWNFKKTSRCGLTHGLLDSSWNINGLGPQNHCHFFSKKSNEIGIDLRAYDITFGQALGEPSYCDSLKFLDKSLKSCNVMNSLKRLYGNNVENVGLTMGIDVEDRSLPIGGTAANFIKEQYQRMICGDRFWYNHANNGLFNASEFIMSSLCWSYD